LGLDVYFDWNLTSAVLMKTRTA